MYQQAASDFATLRSEAPLVVEDDPSFYVYRLNMGDHVQTGMAACFSVDEYDRDLIKKHEKTRPDKEDDRTRHMLAIGAQTGPVFLTYRASTTVDAVVRRVAAGEPLFDFTAPDGVRHELWQVPAGETRPLSTRSRRSPRSTSPMAIIAPRSAARARRSLAARAPVSTIACSPSRFPTTRCRCCPTTASSGISTA